MRLLIIDCSSDDKLAVAITQAASQLHPKPEMISTMNISISRFNVAEFKLMLATLAADAIILNPPSDATTIDTKWTSLLREVSRHVEVVTGKVLFISSVDVLGDSIQRTESASEMPASDFGVLLHMAEMTLEHALSRYYIMRFPYTVNSIQVKRWMFSLRPDDNEIFTLTTVEDMAMVILARIQTGLFGKFHVTPNDFITLSDVMQAEWKTNIRIPDRSLQSKYMWQLPPTKFIWDRIIS